MQISYKALVIAMSSLALSACNDDNSNQTTDNNTTPPVAQIQTARFIDGNLSGLSYSSESQQGVIGNDGKFNYKTGETVSFKLGGITLGSIKPSANSLLFKNLNNGLTDQANLSNSSINRTVLLQTLDSDSDLINGIQLDSTILSKLKDASTPDFAATPEQFATQLDTLLSKAAITASRIDASLAKDNLLVAEAKAVGKATEKFSAGAINAVERYVIPDIYVPYSGTDANTKAAFPKGFPLAVGSGLSFVSDKNGVMTFYAITDRGPNADSPTLADGSATKVFPVPQFAPTLVQLSIDTSGARISAQHELNLNGKKITGLPLPSGTVGSSNETALSESLLNSAGSDINGLDTEAIALDSDGLHGWICDEYGPFVAKIELASGKIVEKFGPGTGLPQLIAKRQPNRGCEGLAYDNGKLYVMVQSTLDISKNSALFTRLVEFDPKTRTSKTYAYPINPADWQDGKSGKAKLGDLVALGKGRFVTIEQGTFADNKIHNKLYVLNISNATDINELKSASDELEKIKELSKLQAAGVTLISKRFLADLKDYGWLMEKAEGLTVVNNTTLAISNDNDFGVQVQALDKAGKSVDATELSVDARGNVTDKNGNSGFSYRIVPNKPQERHSQLWYIRLNQPLNP